jgi:hypothetical protein
MKPLLFLLMLLPGLAFAAEDTADEDRVSMGSDVRVEEGEDLQGDVVVIGANAQIDGHVRGDVVVLGGQLSLGPKAKIDGDAVHLIGHFERAEGALVAGSRVGVGQEDAEALAGRIEGAASASAGTDLAVLEVRPPPTVSAGGSWLARLGSWLLGSLFLLVVGLLFLNTWPERARNLRRTLEAAPGWSLLMGSLVSLGMGLLGLLLTISVVGALALPFLVTLGIGIWLAGLTGLLEAVGDRLPLPASARGRGPAFVAGCAVFAVVGVGWTAGGFPAVLSAFVVTASGCMAVGASVLSGLGRNPYSGA